MHHFDGPREQVVGASIALLAYDQNHQQVAAVVAGRGPAVGVSALRVVAGAGLLVRQARYDSAAAFPLPPADQLHAAPDLAQFLRDCLVPAGTAAEEQLAAALLDGRLAAVSGERCPPWSGTRSGAGVVCLTRQGVSPATAQAAVDEFAATPGQLPERIVQAMIAAQYVEGSRRRLRSTALLALDVGRVSLDLRVDDHAQPLEELRRILAVFRFHSAPSGQVDTTPLTDDLVVEVQSLLRAGGYLRSEITGVYDAPTYDALARWLHDEELGRRFQSDATIDHQVLEYLRRRNWR